MYNIDPVIVKCLPLIKDFLILGQTIIKEKDKIMKNALRVQSMAPKIA